MEGKLRIILQQPIIRMLEKLGKSIRSMASSGTLGGSRWRKFLLNVKKTNSERNCLITLHCTVVIVECEAYEESRLVPKHDFPKVKSVTFYRFYGSNC